MSCIFIFFVLYLDAEKKKALYQIEIYLTPGLFFHTSMKRKESQIL